MPLREPALAQPASTFELALAQIGARAAELDANPRFPRESFDALLAAGIPQLAGERARTGLRREIAVVRALAGVDGATARILDGHFNGVERLALQGPRELRASELARVANGELLLGVWGADPTATEGEPARIELAADGTTRVLRGVKTFCSGAGGVQRALVVARDEREQRRVAYVDVTRAVEIDRGWYRASGLRASESHRVEFCDTPVLAILGGANELTREPWFARDAVRTAATWAGLADCIARAAVEALGTSTRDELRLHAIGRMRVALSTIDRWLEHAATQLGDAVEMVDADAVARADGADTGAGTVAAANGDAGAGEDAAALAGECRVALAEAARAVAAEAVRACGSRALVGGGTLDRARRDLDLFLLQHRLDPKLVEIGARTLGGSER